MPAVIDAQLVTRPRSTVHEDFREQLDRVEGDVWNKYAQATCKSEPYRIASGIVQVDSIQSTASSNVLYAIAARGILETIPTQLHRVRAISI